MFLTYAKIFPEEDLGKMPNEHKMLNQMAKLQKKPTTQVNKTSYENKVFGIIVVFSFNFSRNAYFWMFMNLKC